MDINTLIKIIARKGLAIADVGSVVSVDEAGGTCDVAIAGKADAIGAWIGESGGVKIVPKVGSDVVLLWINSAMAVVVMVKEVEKIEMRGGDNGGLVNVEALKSWMQKVEGDMNVLKGLLSTTPVAGNGAPLGIVFNPQTRSVADKIEDSLISH